MKHSKEDLPNLIGQGHRQLLNFQQQTVPLESITFDFQKLKKLTKKIWNCVVSPQKTKFSSISQLPKPMRLIPINKIKKLKKRFFQQSNKNFNIVDFGYPPYESNKNELKIYKNFYTIRLALDNVIASKSYIKNFFLKYFIDGDNRKKDLKILFGQYFDFDFFLGFLENLTRTLNLNTLGKKLFNESFIPNFRLNYSKPFYMQSGFLKNLQLLPDKFISDKSVFLTIARNTKQKKYLKTKFKKFSNFGFENINFDFIKKNLLLADISQNVFLSNMKKFSFGRVVKSVFLKTFSRLNKFYRKNKFTYLDYNRFINNLADQKTVLFSKNFKYLSKLNLFNRKYSQTRLYYRQQLLLAQLKKKIHTSGLLAKKLPEFFISYKFLTATYLGHNYRFHLKQNSGLSWRKSSKKFAYYFPFRFNLENFLSYYSGAKTMEPLNKETTIYAQLPRLPYNPHITGTFKRKFLAKNN
jgi:hypothetical protein